MLNKSTPKRRYWKKSIYYVLTKKNKPKPIIAPLHFVEKIIMHVCKYRGDFKSFSLSSIYLEICLPRNEAKT